MHVYTKKIERGEDIGAHPSSLSIGGFIVNIFLEHQS